LKPGASPFHIEGTAAKLVGIVDGAPDEQTASRGRLRNIRSHPIRAAG
jgi:hypothetical protein